MPADDRSMTHSRGFLSITVLIGLGLCVVVYLSVRATLNAHLTGGEAAVVTQPRENAELPAPTELAKLRRELAHLELRVQTQEQRLAADLADTEATELVASVDPRTDPEARAEYERSRREYIVGVDAAFRKEPTSPAWSSTTASMIHAAMADNDLRQLGRNLECRSHTCRVEIADDGSASAAG